MKKEGIEGINKIGKLGLILTVILSVSCYIFMIYAIGLALIIHNAPKSLAEVTVSTNVKIDMDLSETDLESTVVKTLQEYLDNEGANIGIGSMILYLTNAEANENGGVYDFGGVTSKFAFKDLWVVLVYIIVLLAATCIMLIFNGMFARTLKKCKSPFEEGVLRDLNNFSIALVIWGVVAAIVSATVKSVFSGYAKIGLIEIVIIVLCIVLFFFARIWKYAAEQY